MKTYPFLAVFICLCVNTAAQEYSFKYGKITPDELRMTLYVPEPYAPSVFIYDDRDIHYSFGNSIQLLCYRTVKIKVFKDEGVKWGDVAIDFGNYQLSKEVVSRIDAAAYNLVDGKTVKTQLKRQNIFHLHAVGRCRLRHDGLRHRLFHLTACFLPATAKETQEAYKACQSFHNEGL